jgi:hypothetical protein
MVFNTYSAGNVNLVLCWYRRICCAVLQAWGLVVSDVTSLQEVKLEKEFQKIMSYKPCLEEMLDEGPMYGASKALRNHKKHMLELIKQGKAQIIHASPELCDDEDFLADALKGDMLGFKHASDRLKESGNFAFKAIQLSEYAIEYVSTYHPMYDDLVVEALMINAEVLALLSDERKDDFDTVLVAVRRDGAAIQYASPELQENEIIVMEAMNSNGYAIALLPMYLQARSDVQEASRKSIEAIHRKFGRQDTVVEFGDKVQD